MGYVATKKYNKRREVETWHFSKRCKERLGYAPPIHTIRGMIMRGELKVLHRTSRTRTCYLFIENEVEYVLVYDNSRHTPVTIYPFVKEDWVGFRR